MFVLLGYLSDINNSISLYAWYCEESGDYPNTVYSLTETPVAGQDSIYTNTSMSYSYTVAVRSADTTTLTIDVDTGIILQYNRYPTGDTERHFYITHEWFKATVEYNKGNVTTTYPLALDQVCGGSVSGDGERDWYSCSTYLDSMDVSAGTWGTSNGTILSSKRPQTIIYCTVCGIIYN